MEIDLGQEIVINVKLGDKVFKLREPTMNDIQKMSGMDKDDHAQANKMLQDFVIGLGMPKDVVENLGIMKLQKLTKGLTESFSEKK